MDSVPNSDCSSHSIENQFVATEIRKINTVNVIFKLLPYFKKRKIYQRLSYCTKENQKAAWTLSHYIEKAVGKDYQINENVFEILSLFQSEENEVDINAAESMQTFNDTKRDEMGLENELNFIKMLTAGFYAAEFLIKEYNLCSTNRDLENKTAKLYSDYLQQKDNHGYSKPSTSFANNYVSSLENGKVEVAKKIECDSAEVIVLDDSVDMAEVQLLYEDKINVEAVAPGEEIIVSDDEDADLWSEAHHICEIVPNVTLNDIFQELKIIFSYPNRKLLIIEKYLGGLVNNKITSSDQTDSQTTEKRRKTPAVELLKRQKVVQCDEPIARIDNHHSLQMSHISSIPLSHAKAGPSSESSFQAIAGPSSESSFQAIAGPSNVSSFQAVTGPSNQPSLQAVAGPSNQPSLQAVAGLSNDPRLQAVAGPSNDPLLQAVAGPSNEPTAEPAYINTYPQTIHAPMPKFLQPPITQSSFHTSLPQRLTGLHTSLPLFHQPSDSLSAAKLRQHMLVDPYYKVPSNYNPIYPQIIPRTGYRPTFVPAINCPRGQNTFKPSPSGPGPNIPQQVTHSTNSSFQSIAAGSSSIISSSQAESGSSLKHPVVNSSLVGIAGASDSSATVHEPSAVMKSLFLSDIGKFRELCDTRKHPVSVLFLQRFDILKEILVNYSDELIATAVLKCNTEEDFERAVHFFLDSPPAGSTDITMLDELLDHILSADLDVPSVAGSSSGSTTPELPQSATEMEEQIETQIELITEMFSDADPDFIKMRVHQCNGSKSAIQNLACELAANSGYPKYSDYLTKKKESEIRQKFIEGMSLEEFFEYFDGNEEMFTKQTPTSHLYRINSRDQIMRDYPSHLMTDINLVLKKHESKYFLSFNSLKSITATRKSKRSNGNPPGEYDDAFLKERCYVRMLDQINAHKKKVQEDKQSKFDNAKADGTLQECGCCYDDELLFEDMAACGGDTPHYFCNTCIRRQSEELIGQSKLEFLCLEGECKATFPLAVLKKVLKSSIFSNLLKRKQMQEIAAADIPDLVSCPFCNFATIMPNPEDKVFKCLNEECQKDSCRLCKERNHVPLKCEEVEKQKHTDQRTYLENEMTKAILRECYRCKKMFIKEEGCNKMNCSCGAIMCYICKKPIDGYNHFSDNNRPGANSQKCPLWTNSLTLHDTELKRRVDELKRDNNNEALPNDPLSAPMPPVQLQQPQRRPIMYMPGINPMNMAPGQYVYLHQYPHPQGNYWPGYYNF